MSEVASRVPDKSDRDQLATGVEQLRFYTATQYQLMWMRFKKHHLARVGSMILGLFLIIVVFCEFLAPIDPMSRNNKYLYGPPQHVHFFDDAGVFHLRPFVYEVQTTRDPVTLGMEFEENRSVMWPIRFFHQEDSYRLWGLIPTDIHLFGVETGFIHLLGTDEMGRDLFSRLMYATRISLSIGVIGILIAFVVGLAIGGVSGYFGGVLDMLLQRLIEFVKTIPTLPLWMSLAAVLPKEWSPLQIYFTITLIMGLLGWTTLARRVRSKFLSLREEDFIVAARVAGCNNTRIITRHMMPAFLSYILVDLSTAFPSMILGETALSFVGLGLRPPVVSWGVLLKAAQTATVVLKYPWLLSPAAFVIVAVLAFSFVGDGLRDAADPYAQF